MVLPLGPGKFYGTSLPRPRIYTDVKFSDERVDPPVPVMDPLLSWASEAHWSMGGLSFKRLRLQGRIEGSVSKLRADREKKNADNKKTNNSAAKSSSPWSDYESPPPAPIAAKRRRFMDLVDEDEDDEEDERKGRVRRRLVKKLGDDFDRVAAETGGEKADRSEAEGGSRKTRRQILEEEDDDEVEKVNKGKSKGKKVTNGSGSAAVRPRSSPRLAKRV